MYSLHTDLSQTFDDGILLLALKSLLIVSCTTSIFLYVSNFP